ncbi:MAG TPA: hypothetical protein VLK82_03450, partial [Candidatus Tectomicrobia bacterium]|nr:hypothetical protein [Candidatus Tectomicrobia bacterium]
KYTPAAMQAAQGTQASFERLQTAVTDLAAAFGQGLAPALAEAARALTAFISQGRDGAGILGDSLLPIIRQITSVLLGLAGAFVVTGKAIAAFSVGLIGDTEAARIGWQDVGDTISNTLALQEKMLAGGFAAAPGAQAAAPAAKLKPITLGAGTDAGKAATRTAAEKESERIAERQKDLVTEIANAYDAANNALESGVELERTRLEQRLRAAQFSQADLETLMATYDATERLLEQRKTDEKLAGDRLQLSTQLQESLDKQLFTERELLQRKLTAIGFSKEEAALKLKMFDTEVRLREEAEQRKEAEQDALAATKEHLATLARLQEQLQPRVRQTRAQELQGTISEMAEETSDPFTLAQADIQRQATLRTEWLDSIFEDLEQMGEEVASTFVDMATTGEFSFKRLADSFSRMAIEMVADAIGLKEAIGSWIKAGVQAMGGQALGGSGGGLFGLFGGGAGAGMEAGAGAITQTPFGGGGGAFGAEGMSFAFGGGMAAGGPVMPGKFYTVGERGPETLVAGGPGRIIPNGGGGGMNVTMNIVTNDANSFRLNERQIAAQAARTLSRARRNL